MNAGRPAYLISAVAVFLTALCGPLAGAPTFTSVEAPEGARAREMAEIRAGFDGVEANPFDPAAVRLAGHFEGPGGERLTVPGFYGREYSRSSVNGREQVEAGGDYWMVRFTPPVAGKWSYHLEVVTGEERARTRTRPLMVSEGEGDGSVGVSREDPRRLAFASGRPYLAIGQNVCWGSQRWRTYDFDRYFDKMAAAGCTYARVWFCTWDMQLDGETLGRLRLDNAWRMDEVMRSAARHGIQVMLCLDNFLDLTSIEKQQQSPYFTAKGGPCTSARDFFENDEAERHYRNRLRYCVARWGAFPNLLAWELFNEVNYVVPEGEDLLLEWTASTARYLQGIDAYGHLVTTSLGNHDVWPELWALPEMDIVQVHAYIQPMHVSETHEDDDGAEMVERVVTDLRRFGKPVLVSEYGFLGTNENNPMNDSDVAGIHLHNGIWAAVTAGAAGTAMTWWWDTYVRPRNLYHHFGGVARAFKGAPAGRWLRLRSGPGSVPRVRGLRTGEFAVVWIQHPANTWHRRLLEGGSVPSVKETPLKLRGFEATHYRVSWINAYSGTVAAELTATPVDGTLSLTVPVAAPDVACRIEAVD